ncbi:MAG: DegV family EDD domain-containing protein [Desulfobacteraceae bacterium]|nr:MAG: DegV family EDD domain-containing protein [Desulfobacteraceae bacterium]
MERTYSSALILGYERMSAWSDLLDQINVFPVADADTGRNLKISLAPLRRLDDNPHTVPQHLIRAATGNSGNIAAGFFSELLGVRAPGQLPEAIRTGLSKAQQAVSDPKPGTMLTVFEALAQAAPPAHLPPADWDLETIMRRLEKTVADTSEILPELKQAGVVDSGALGMFIFLEAFLCGLAGRHGESRPVTEIFRGKLKIAAGWNAPDDENDYCVSAMVRPEGSPEEARRRLADCGQSVVVTENDDLLKVHLHTDDRRGLQSHLADIGQVVGWSEEKIDIAPLKVPQTAAALHIMTDAAGSITVEDARELGITLLNSYLVVGEQVCPETLYAPGQLYTAMRAGTRVSTAQASMFERHQCYLSAISRFERVLYLCVGSVYTGNFETAAAWKTQNDPEQRLTIIDTGAASGRLGIVALAAAHYARRTVDPEAVVRFAREAVAHSDELVFLDQLKFLAAGGRISKTKGFLGDLLHKKPIITPTAHGAAKVGIVRNRAEQLAFARDRLQKSFDKAAAAFIMLQYSDNREWVEQTAAAQIREMLPAARIVFRPLSLTSGAHMGPGTWAAAYLPAAFNPYRELT